MNLQTILGLGFLDNLPENFIIFMKTLLKLFANIAKTSADPFESTVMKIKHPFFLQHGGCTVFFTPDVSQFSTYSPVLRGGQKQLGYQSGRHQPGEAGAKMSK